MNNNRFCAGIIILVFCISLSGCTNTQQNQASRGTYPKDGYLGATSANPGYPTSPTFHNYSADVRMVKSALADIEGVQDIRVVINGSDMGVTIKVAKQTSLQDAKHIQQKAEDSVSYMLPRYNVKVNVKSGPKRILTNNQ